MELPQQVRSQIEFGNEANLSNATRLGRLNRQTREIKDYITLFALILITTLSLLADNVKPSPTFTNLRDALVFIDAALDKEDWSGLTQALYPPFQAHDPNRNYWKQLKDERGKSHLADDFPNSFFPTTGDTLIIGASPFVGAKLAGWSRIKFLKVQDGWHLNAVYGVR